MPPPPSRASFSSGVEASRRRGSGRLVGLNLCRAVCHRRLPCPFLGCDRRRACTSRCHRRRPSHRPCHFHRLCRHRARHRARRHPYPWSHLPSHLLLHHGRRLRPPLSAASTLAAAASARSLAQLFVDHPGIHEPIAHAFRIEESNEAAVGRLLGNLRKALRARQVPHIDV